MLPFTCIERNMQVVAVFIPNRILPIAIIAKSCDIYPHKRARLRSAKNNSFDKEVLVRLCFLIIPGSPFAWFFTDEYNRYAAKDQHFLPGIRSLLKQGALSYTRHILPLNPIQPLLAKPGTDP